MSSESRSSAFLKLLAAFSYSSWAQELGFARVVGVLENLCAHYGEERYRLSPWLRRQAASR